MLCRSCEEPLPADADPQRLYCNQACRSRAHRRRQAARLTEMRALVLRQTESIIAGDFDALAQVDRDAARLFGV
jgi:hypothetical protein